MQSDIALHFARLYMTSLCAWQGARRRGFGAAMQLNTSRF